MRPAPEDLVPIAVGRPDQDGPPASGSKPAGARPWPRLHLLVAGLAVLGVLNLIPDPTGPSGPPAAELAAPDVPGPVPADPVSPLAAGALVRATEAASRPGVVWPPPGPLRNRQEYTTIWTGTHILIWRGPKAGRPLDGSAYDSEAHSWRSTAPAPIESRSNPAAIWDGREVFVWGGHDAGGKPLADGAVYDPSTDQWRRVAPSPLDGRVPLVAAWTGREVLVVGARTRAPTDGRIDGAAYDPERDQWRRLAVIPQLLGEAVAAWTGSELIVYGGLVSPSTAADPASGLQRARGAAYDPAADRWRILPVAPLSSPFLTAAWTGRKFVAWDDARRAASFDPRSGRWSPVSGLGSSPPPA